MNLDRRSFLRAAGVSIALPWMDSLVRGSTAVPRRRMVFICAPLGMHPSNFFPAKTGREYEASPYLEVLQPLREDFTVISGLSHPEIATGHDSQYSFLTGAHHHGFMRGGFRNTISVDQLAAEKMGGDTRVPSLSLACEGSGISWTRSGALVPSANFPSSVFSQLFIEGSAEEVEAQRRRLQYGQSLLDQVREEARRMNRVLGAADREKLEEYLTSVRDLEKQLGRSEDSTDGDGELAPQPHAVGALDGVVGAVDHRGFGASQQVAGLARHPGVELGAGGEPEPTGPVGGVGRQPARRLPRAGSERRGTDVRRHRRRDVERVGDLGIRPEGGPREVPRARR